ncbi:MAG: hypothetical protein ABH822_01770 [Patescibacteria group bacterium]
MKPKGKPVPIVQYHIGKWTRPLEPSSKNPDEGGGLWVNPKRSGAVGLARYIWKRYSKKVRVFTCRIDKILCRPSSYRLKTNRVMLLEEVDISFLYTTQNP